MGCLYSTNFQLLGCTRTAGNPNNGGECCEKQHHNLTTVDGTDSPGCTEELAEFYNQPVAMSNNMYTRINFIVFSKN